MELIKQLLDEAFARYNQASFIDNDPISIPHLFSDKEDIEIAGFLSATIAWGSRKSIIASGMRMIRLMDNAPAAFVRGFSESDLQPMRKFVHRTFNADDLGYFLYALKNIYQHYGGMEQVFFQAMPAGRKAGMTQGKTAEEFRGEQEHGTGSAIKEAIIGFREVFFTMPHPVRTRKHLGDPGSGSAAKRINMFLRWMVRKDKAGVDFGLWKRISPSELYCPLDVHSGTVARKLGLLTRRQDDWKAVEELTAALRQFDPSDPVKYDFALFGMGIDKDSVNILGEGELIC